MTYDESLGVIAASLNSGAQYSGSLTDFNLLAGDWESDIYGTEGTFTGERIGGDPSAIHRLSGIILNSDVVPDADNAGYIAVDVFADNSATAILR